MIQGQQEIKVIVLGGPAVGKSSLLIRFVTDKFSQLSETTLGTAFLSKIHNYRQGKSARFQVWDTAGQEKYRAITQIYYRNSQVAILVYDITKKESFKTLKTWVEELLIQGPSDIGSSVVMVVVGNKIDKAEQEQVPYNQAKQYAQQINAIFKLTSAKNGNGVFQLFTAIALRLEQKGLQKNRETFQLRKDDENNQSKGNEGKKCCK